MPATRAALESLLRTRQLDRTLTTSRPGVEFETASCGVTPLDARLGGGFPRGQVSELVGPRSSGRTSLLLQLVATATARGELVALVDALDMFDVESAVAAGADLERLLWIRGFVACRGSSGGQVSSSGGQVSSSGGQVSSSRAETCPPQTCPPDLARAASGEFRPRRVRRGRGAAVRDPPAAVHDVVAAATDGRRQPDRLSAGRVGTHGEKRRRADASSRDSRFGIRDSFRRPTVRRARH